MDAKVECPSLLIIIKPGARDKVASVQNTRILEVRLVYRTDRDAAFSDFRNH